jgi:PIN domain nuclease of toxin-antitoxin system
MDAALLMPRLRLVPLTPRIAYQSTALPQPFHSDPADQIVVATARDQQATVITADERIGGYEHVSTLW